MDVPCLVFLRYILYVPTVKSGRISQNTGEEILHVFWGEGEGEGGSAVASASATAPSMSPAFFCSAGAALLQNCKFQKFEIRRKRTCRQLQLSLGQVTIAVGQILPGWSLIRGYRV